MNNNIEDLLDNIEMSSPEARHFNFLINNKDYKEAEELLKEHVSEEDSKLIIQYYKNKNNENVDLIEININESIEGKAYLLRIGSSVSNGYRTKDSKFISGSDYYSFESINQIWEIVKR